MPTRLEKGIDWGTRLPDLTVTYYFEKPGVVTKTHSGKVEALALSAYDKAQFKAAFAAYESITNLKFKQVNKAEKADFVLIGYDGVDSPSLGSMGPPGYKHAGVGAFDVTWYGWGSALNVGGYAYITIIHELGHGLGLAHPFDRGGGSVLFPGVRYNEPDDLGKFDLNQSIFTTMSYNDGWVTNPDGMPPAFGNYGYQGTPMAIEIAVLQAKYGANEKYNKGKTVYELPDVNAEGTYFSCIWDAGGRDAIVNRSAISSTIDLRPATLKVEPGGGGYISKVDGIFGGYTIAKGVVIEVAKGGSGDDVLRGNGKDNRLIGGDGNDRLHGGPGKDRLEGNAGDDVMIGGRGQDRLFAGPDNSVMTGGKGKDTFIFDAEPTVGALGTITDFKPDKDVIHLAADAFAGLVRGKLAKSAFAIGDAAADALDRIVYDAGTGALRYDADGAGTTDAIVFAQLSAGLSLSHRDFVIVA